MVGCAHETHRVDDVVPVEVTPNLVADSEAGRMLIGRWDGQQSGIWGYGRHPYRTLIVDRIVAGRGPMWQAEGRWGYTDQCCARVAIQIEQERSYMLVSFTGPVGDRYELRTVDGTLMRGTMRYDYDNRQDLTLTRVAPVGRALPPAAPIPDLDALVGVWRGWVAPPNAPTHFVEVTVTRDGAYRGARFSRGVITVTGARHADVRTASGLGGVLTLHRDPSGQTLRFVFTGGTVADLTREP
jgi:hypothetical protein